MDDCEKAYREWANNVRDLDLPMTLGDAWRACWSIREQQLAALREVAEEFCDRRDRGEVRSTYTYNRFKAALAQEGE